MLLPDPPPFCFPPLLTTPQQEQAWFQKIQTIIENTSSSAVWNRKHGIVENNVTTYTVRCLEDLNEKIAETMAIPSSQENNCVEKKTHILLEIIEQLWAIVLKYGTYYLEDFVFLLSLCVYKKPHIEFPSPCSADKLRILHKYFHLFHCKVITKAQLIKECGQDASLHNYRCLLPETKQNYYFRIHGMRLLLVYQDKIYMLYGVFEDILPTTLPCQSTEHFLFQCKQTILQQGLAEGFHRHFVEEILPFLSLSELFLFPPVRTNKPSRIVRDWFDRVETFERLVLEERIETIVQKFNEFPTYDKIQFFRFLLQSKKPEVQYITSLLYDLFSLSKTAGPSFMAASAATTTNAATTPTDFNNVIYNSLPWKQKQMLKNSVHNSVQLMQNYMVAYDTSRITLDQQVFMMRVPEKVKEKAMLKLREVKSKAEEMNGKSRQYLDGLLRIPFGKVREEPILTLGHKIKTEFQTLFPNAVIPSYDFSSLSAYLHQHFAVLAQERSTPAFWSRYKMAALAPYAQSLGIPAKTKKNDLIQRLTEMFQEKQGALQSLPEDVVWNAPRQLLQDIGSVKTKLHDIENTLDRSVYGHKPAKRKIVQIIGQWLSSTDKRQGGYCFGFEGDPGIGKTSLANQGLSQCLQDANGQPRPFHIIALGGCCNSSTLEGHNYTYSNSTWGRIVDILMESKCMNPIIYIDELDKVSKTENGKEIIGILIHIIDSSQNANFQDKYFSGIDIDLSQVLFVFSYNHPEDIDKILLDRIHRISFDSLSLQDKVVIVRQFILPTLEKKMGFTAHTVQLDDATIEYLIDTYTNESGIRKTKQLLFDVYSQINLDLLHCTEQQIQTLPVVLSPAVLDEKYLQKYHKNTLDKIHSRHEVGVMNALYATSNGGGGIIKIECMMIPANHLLEMKLTGSLGKVFTESMEICKNLAWALTPEEVKAKWLRRFESSKIQGLHVHFGDCNTPKEGASASLASALTIYSVFMNKSLRNDIAMTGETNLFGDAKRIGGLEAKLVGGIKAGVKIMFYPEENQSDFDQFFEKIGHMYKDTHHFFAISNLRQVIQHSIRIFTD